MLFDAGVNLQDHESNFTNTCIMNNRWEVYDIKIVQQSFKDVRHQHIYDSYFINQLKKYIKIMQ